MMMMTPLSIHDDRKRRKETYLICASNGTATTVVAAVTVVAVVAVVAVVVVVMATKAVCW